MKLTNEEWDLVDQNLQHFQQSVVLEIDGHQVVLCLERITQFQNGIKVFVDGGYQAEWIAQFLAGEGPGAEIIRKFYPRHNQPVWTHSQKRKLIRYHGLEAARKSGVDDVVEIPDLYWTSWEGLKAQLLKECDSIRLNHRSIAA